MKRTKNMIYQQTPEARELFIFAVNTAEIYPQIECIINSLSRKMKKGVYNADKAVDAYYYAVQSANNLYKKWFGYAFSVADRFTVATDLQNYFYDDVVDAAAAAA